MARGSGAATYRTPKTGLSRESSRVKIEHLIAGDDAISIGANTVQHPEAKVQALARKFRTAASPIGQLRKEPGNLLWFRAAGLKDNVRPFKGVLTGVRVPFRSIATVPYIPTP